MIITWTKEIPFQSTIKGLGKERKRLKMSVTGRAGIVSDG